MRANWYGLLGEHFARPVGRRDRRRGAPRHPRLADQPSRRALLADRGVRRGLPHAPADPRRLHFRSPATTACSSEHDLPDVGVLACRAALSESRWPTSSTRSGARTPARSRCTTTRSFLQHLTATTAAPSTWRRSTSCGCASAACRATTSSARLFHMNPVTSFEELTDNPVGRGAAPRSTATSSGST